MSVGTRGLHFRFEDFIGLFISNDIAKTKLPILAFLCCKEFVKNSSATMFCNVRNYMPQKRNFGGALGSPTFAI